MRATVAGTPPGCKGDAMAASTITISRTVPARPETVFADWTDATRLATWWWPQLPGTTYSVDARPGGAYRIEGPAIGATVSGTYGEVDPPRRLVFSWVWQDDGEPASGSDTVVVSFEPDGAGTAVTVAHTSERHEPGEATEQGWSDVLGRLVQSTSSRS
jgi:uncharacterized protein YndB with AHSA1/START domain